MYTQCSKCETIFKLSAEVLRAAGGQVRCGKCGEVFSALARLAEDSAAFTTGESALELETRADSILESAIAPKVAREVAKDHEEYAPPGVEIAQLEVLDWTEEDQALQDRAQYQGSDAGPDDRSMEFTLPPGELDRIFIESKARERKPAPADEPTEMRADAPDAPIDMPVHMPIDAPIDVPIDVVIEVPIDIRAETPSDTPASPLASSPASSPASSAASWPATSAAAPPAAAPPATPALPPHPESVAAEGLADAEPRPPSSRHRFGGFEVPEDVRRDMLAGLEPESPPEFELQHFGRDDARRRPFLIWLGAAIVAALLLVGQIAHQNQAWLAAQPPGTAGAALRALFGALGAPPPPAANLSAYQLRQWGVTGDPDASGTLRVRASILNTAVQLQPYPLLRVTLADRFGKSIGTRDFEPAEYLGKPTARLLAPGERVDATLNILDPGKTAEGFEIDVCLRGAERRIACANDAAPQPKP